MSRLTSVNQYVCDARLENKTNKNIESYLSFSMQILLTTSKTKRE